MSKNHYVSQLIIKRFGPSVNTFDLCNHTVIVILYNRFAQTHASAFLYGGGVDCKFAFLCHGKVCD